MSVPELMDWIELIIIGAYAGICLVLYRVFRALCRRGFVFRAPRSPAVYYILSFTWGLPTTLIGLIVALALIVTGHRPEKYGWNIRFRLKINFGFSVGLVFVSPGVCADRLCAHEHGHSIQNIYFGPFMPGVVSMPSSLRFHWRRIRGKLKKANMRPYDSAWFEGSATGSGLAFLERLRQDALTDEIRRQTAGDVPDE